MTWLRPLALFMVARAAIITPIGLYETVELDTDPYLATFTYATDSGSVGLGTLPPSDLGFSRACGSSINHTMCHDSSEYFTVLSGDISAQEPDLRVSQHIALLI